MDSLLMEFMMFLNLAWKPMKDNEKPELVLRICEDVVQNAYLNGKR